MKSFRHLFLLACAMLSPVAAQAQLTPTQFVRSRVDAVIRKRIQQRDLGKDYAAPSVLQTSTSLVDRAAVGDVVTTELGYGPLSSRQEKRAFSTSIAVNFYAFLAGFKNQDPLESKFYADNSGWRDFGVSFSTRKPEGDPLDAAVNFRYRYKNLRDISEGHNDDLFKEVRDGLSQSTNALLDIETLVEQYVLQKYPNKDDDFQVALNNATSVDVAYIDSLIEQRVEDLFAHSAAATKALNSIQRKPQLGISFTNTKTTEGGPNSITLIHTLDFGLIPGLNAALNVGYSRVDKTGKDQNGALAAASLKTRILATKGTFVQFELSSQGRWREDALPVYMVRGAVDLPLGVEGIRIPLSLTYTNRVGPLNKSEVKTQLNFVFDPFAFGSWVRKLGAPK